MHGLGRQRSWRSIQRVSDNVCVLFYLNLTPSPGNTNGQNFELFAAVAEAEGSGIPIAFLLISTSKDAAPLAKEKVLERFLAELKALGVRPKFTLSDKDWSEIDALRANWPEAKHQLCFWHGLRSVKGRLSKNKDTPGPYDVKKAIEEFSFIDPSFVPVGQLEDQSQEVWCPQILNSPDLHTKIRWTRHQKYHTLVFACSSMVAPS